MCGKRSKMEQYEKKKVTILKHVQACNTRANKVHKNMHHKLK